MGLAEVSAVLWRERELLALVLFKLEEKQALHESGRTRWLGRATREVEAVLTEIRRTEIERAVEVDAVAATLGLEPGQTLAGLASAVAEPWQFVLRDHRQAFLRATDEVHARSGAAWGVTSRVVTPSLADFLR